MSTQENKTTIRRGFEEGINQRNMQAFDETIGPTYINHDMPAPARGVEGFKHVIGMFLAAFPDMHVRLRMNSRRATRLRSAGRCTAPIRVSSWASPPLASRSR
jgi:hypothetical protein